MFVKGSKTNANEDATTERSREELESCSRVRCSIPLYVLKVKDDKEEGTEVHSRFQADLRSQVIIARGVWRRSKLLAILPTSANCFRIQLTT